MATVIKQILQQFITRHDTWQVQLLKDWPNIVGNLKTQVVLLKILPDTLIIGIQDSCWLQELYLLSPLLLKQINETLDQPRIKKLHFRAIGISFNKKIDNQMETNNSTVIYPRLDDLQKKQLDLIDDQELRRYLENYYYRSKRVH